VKKFLLTCIAAITLTAGLGFNAPAATAMSCESMNYYYGIALLRGDTLGQNFWLSEIPRCPRQGTDSGAGANNDMYSFIAHNRSSTSLLAAWRWRADYSSIASPNQPAAVVRAYVRDHLDWPYVECSIMYPAESCILSGLTTGTAYRVDLTEVTRVNGSNSNWIFQSSSYATPGDIEPDTSPDPPTIVTVMPGSQSLNVEWRNAGFTGVGTPIESGVRAYTTSGVTTGRSCAVSSGPTTCTITGLVNGTTYVLMPYMTNSAGSSSGPDAQVGTPVGATQTVAWAPTNTSALTTASPLTPNALATTNGDGAISYSVVDAGTTGCVVNASTAILTFSSAGTCQVRATADATATYSPGTSTKTFTITAPVGGGSSGGGSGGSSSGGSSSGGSSSGGSSSGGSSSGGGGSLHEILSVRPASGPVGGGNTIALVGYGFTGVREVRIGDKLCQYTFVNDAHIDVVVPPGERVGPADVSVVLPPAVGRAFAPGGYVFVTLSSVPTAVTPIQASSSPSSAVPTPAVVALARPQAVVAGTQAKIIPAIGALTTSIQKKVGARWVTVRKVTQPVSVTFPRGTYRVVSKLRDGAAVQRGFAIR
jgi:hypothetical protein